MIRLLPCCTPRTTSSGRLRRGAVAALVLLVAFLAGAGSALAAPAVTLTAAAPSTVLYGTGSTVRLTATNTDPIGGGGAVGYNASYRVVLPAGVTLVPGSGPFAPRVLADAPGPGQTTLLFENVADLPPGASYTLELQLAHDPGVLALGDLVSADAGVFVNEDPRWVPDFAPDGTPVAGTESHTGSATASSSSRLTAIEIEKDEPSPEGELLRGVHRNRTHYTLTVRNNHVSPTGDVVVDDYLPAGLEFLGCGASGDDNGSADEYPGSGPLNASTYAAAGFDPADCPAPELVETVTVDPDGAGPLPTAVVTHVRWRIPAALAVDEAFAIQYVAGIPNRENVAWPAVPPPTTGAQGANLDNNTGDETTDEQELTNYATATGFYDEDPSRPVDDETWLTRQAEDVRLLKDAAPEGLRHGQTTTWTLTLNTSEYRSASDVVVTDRVPDGLCPLGESINHEGTAECAGGVGDGPSPAYDVAPTENADGSWAVRWTLAAMTEQDQRVITYRTRTRSHYQENGADEPQPVSSYDRVENDAALTADTAIVPGVDGAPTSTAADASQDELLGEGPTLAKSVQDDVAFRADCTTGGYAATAAGPFAPGDKVCFRLRIDFPQDLDTPDVVVTDFLPPNTTYVPGSIATLPDHTIALPAPSFVTESGVTRAVEWTMPAPVGAGAVFDVVLAVTVQSDPALSDEDLTDNLLKLRHANSPGATFPLRAAAPLELAAPVLGIVKRVAEVNGTPNAGPDDGATVRGGDEVQFAVRVANAGSRAADDVVVWDVLPDEIDCTDLVPASISDGGTCGNTGPSGAPTITWTIPQLAVAGSTTLTYRIVVPEGLAPGTSLDNASGVVEFRTTANDGVTQYVHVPADNIDPSREPGANSAAVDDPSNVVQGGVTLDKSRTTAVTQAGNSAAQATIGERITYTVTLAIPEGTTLHGPISLADALPTGRIAYVAGSATATFDDDGPTGSAPVALPTAGFTLTEAAGTITISRATSLTNTAESGVDTIALTYQADVRDVAANGRSASPNAITNTVTLSSQTQAVGGTTIQQTATSTTAVVEPAVTIAKARTAGAATVAPGDQRTFTLTASNPTGTRVSTANDTVVVDTLPKDVLPVDGGGTPLADGAAIPGSAGAAIWTATPAHPTSSGTITWTVGSIEPGDDATLSYTVEIDEVTGGATLTNTAAVTTTSHPGSPPQAERSYDDDASQTLTLVTLGVAKSVSPASPTPLTIGEQATYTVAVTVPAGIALFDAVAIDALPAGLAFDGLLDQTCVEGAGPTTCALSASLVGPVPGAGPGDPTTIGLYIGDVAAAPVARTVRVRYRAHVVDGDLQDGDTATNTVTAHSNVTDEIVDSGVDAADLDPADYDTSAGPATATVAVGEPALELDKTVSGDTDADDARTTEPGDTYTYSVVVENEGTTPAYDVVVRDTPAAQLVGVVAPDGAAFDVTHPWADSAGERYTEWTIPGPIAPNASVTLTYTASLADPPAITDGQTVANTADITRYLGRPAGDCDDPGDVCHVYDGPSDTVTLTVDLPSLTIAKTTVVGGTFPESGPAEVGQAYPWRIVVTNTATVATAHDVDVTDVLPAGWDHVAGSTTAIRAPGAVALTPGDPAVVAAAGGDTLTWADLTDLAPGGSLTLTFDAIPTTDALTAPGAGTGAGNPHVNTARAAGEDGSGTGGYTTGDDTAEAVLSVPSLAIDKTPDGASRTAGTASSWQVRVRNTGTVTARDVEIVDVLPAGVRYTAGSATVSSSSGMTGFAEVSYAPGTRTIRWTAATLAATTGEIVITVPVTIDADVASGATLTNTASATSDEQPTPVTDPGSFVVATEADVRIAKTAAATAVPGENLTYTLRVDNDGPSDALDVVVGDPLPARTTFVSAAAGCAHAGGTVTCTLGRVAAGASASRTITVRIDPDATAPIDNVATVTTTTPQTDTTDDSDDARTTLTPSVNVRIAKTASPASVPEGGTTTFTLAVHNDGPSTATAVQVTDPLPAGLEPLSASASTGSCTVAGRDVACALGALAPGADASVTVVARVTRAATYENVATVTTSTPDRNPADDTSTATVTAEPLTDLRIEKTGPDRVAAGGQATYRLTATNRGPSPATGVTVTDRLPDGVELVAASLGCALDGRTVRCPIGALAVGASAAVEVTVRVPVTLAGLTLQDVGGVSGDQTDPVLTDNSDPHDTVVGEAADLRIAKTSSSLTSGGETTYRLVVHNAGPVTATGVRIVDPLPAGTTFLRAQSTQGTCTEAAGTVTCTLGSLPAGTSAAVQLVVRVTAPAGTVVANRATVSGDQLDPEPSNDGAQTDGTVVAGPPARRGLSLEKTSSETRPGIDRPFTYTLTVRNAGPDAARNVVVTDPMPDGLTVDKVAATQGSCVVREAVVRCALGTLAADRSARIRIVARAVRPGDYRNVALASADGDQVTAGSGVGAEGGVASVKVTAAQAGRLTLSKRRTTVARTTAGSDVRFRITVRATGGAVSDVRVCDRLPRGLVFVRTGGARFSAGQACWTVALLRSGTSRTFTVVARAERDARGLLRNVATARGSGTAARRATASVRVRSGAVRSGRGGGVTG